MKTINSKASVADLTRGWQDDKPSRSRICLFCGRSFARDEIFAIDQCFYNSRKAVELHIQTEHGGLFSALTHDKGRSAGLSEIQYLVLSAIAEGCDDAAIAGRLENRALSTVRAHRRNLRLKYEEAKIFVAAMEAASRGAVPDQQQLDFGPSLPLHDERSLVSQAEAEAILAKFFRPDGSLPRIPPKEKQKLVVLNRLKDLFEHGRRYSDNDVRGILGKINEDHALLRRYLVDYHFLERSDDGRQYWRK